MIDLGNRNQNLLKTIIQFGIHVCIKAVERERKKKNLNSHSCNLNLQLRDIYIQG